ATALAQPQEKRRLLFLRGAPVEFGKAAAVERKDCIYVRDSHESRVLRVRKPWKRHCDVAVHNQSKEERARFRGAGGAECAALTCADLTHTQLLQPLVYKTFQSRIGYLFSFPDQRDPFPMA